MATVGVREAKAQFSQLLKRVEQGEEITICRRNIPVARLVLAAREPRRPGRLKGRLHISEDSDAPLPAEILDVFRA